MTLKAQRISILGAGIGGLSAALALARRGAQVTVFEQAEEISEVGAGIQVSPNGFAVLRALGLENELLNQAVRGQAVELRDYRASRQVLRLDLTGLAPDQGYYFVHRADLIRILARAVRAAGVKIRLMQRIEEITLGDKILLKNAQGAETGTRLLIGADGLHSQLRPVLNGPATPFFTRQVAWRATVPARGDEPNVATVHMAPGRHLVHYPLRGGTLINIVAVQHRKNWAAEGWNHQDDPDNLRAAFSDFDPKITALLNRVDRTYLWGLFRHPVARKWHSANAALLGDAAHPTLPFLAQGACMALEDSWVLADSLTDAQSIPDGLAAYETRRKARAARVVAAASKNARNYHLRFAPFRLAAHSALRLTGMLAPSLALKKFDWLYGVDVTKPAA